jgi:hypothetical protein
VGRRRLAQDKKNSRRRRAVICCFADSGDKAIRSNGTKLIDTAWQAGQISDENAFSVLALVGPMTESYTGLTGACAAHGVTLPPLSAISSPPASRPAEENFPNEGVTTTTAPSITVASYKVGQTANLTAVDAPVGQTGAVAPRLAVDPTRQTNGRLQVLRVKFSRGDEFDRPSRGLYMGAYLKAQVLHNTDLTWDLYAVVNGHHYDATFASGFEPPFESVDLGAGETNEGWMVFDVPTRHGQLVLIDALSNAKVATWTF